MSVKINPITDHQIYEVNGNTIFKNKEGFWKNKDHLSFTELMAFIQYEDIVIKNPRFKRHIKAIYLGYN